MSETIDRPDAGALVVAGVSLPAPRIIAADTNDLLRKLAEEIGAHKPDVSTPKGRKEIASLAYKVSTTKADLIRLGKGLTEEWRKSTKAVNEECSVIEANMDALRDEVRRPLTEYEDREKARVQAHVDALSLICESPSWGPQETSSDIRKRIAHLESYSQRNWDEFAQKAADTIANELLRAKAFLTDALAREEAEMEAERKRLEAEEAARQEAARQQREREERIRREAAEEARLAEERRQQEAQARERQRVERERLAAERAAQEERDRLEEERRQAEESAAAEIAAMEEALRIEADRVRQAEEQAAKAERDRIEAARLAEERRVAAATQAEADRLAAIEAERQRAAAEKAAEEHAAAERARNIEIKRRVNFDAAADFVGSVPGITEEIAKSVVIAIAKGQIRNVRISY